LSTNDIFGGVGHVTSK